MFPNFRLMIVAILASIVALSGGFGLFAAFRVNHDRRVLRLRQSVRLVADDACREQLCVADHSFGVALQVSRSRVAGREPRHSAQSLFGLDALAARHRIVRRRH